MGCRVKPGNDGYCSRVPGFVRQHAWIDPDLAQRAEVFLLDIAAKDQIRIGVAMQPAIVLDFAFQLSRRPAGIAQREYRVLWPATLRDRFQDVDGRGQANLLVDPKRRVLDAEIARM